MTNALKQRGLAGIGVTTTSCTQAPVKSDEPNTARFAFSDATKKITATAHEPNTPTAMRVRGSACHEPTVTTPAAIVTPSAIGGGIKRTPQGESLTETSQQSPTPSTRNNA